MSTESQPFAYGAECRHRVLLDDECQRCKAEETPAADTPTPERVTLTDKEREALARHLYDVEGFHAADSWATETPITRGRYEALAEAVDGSRWLAGVLAAREQALREEIAGEIEAHGARWDHSADWRGGVDEAADIARGGAR